MQIGRQFLLLLWKNYTVQIRRKIGTFFEIFLPLFFTIILVVLRVTVIKDETKSAISYQPFDVSSLPHNLTHNQHQQPYKEIQLAYAPNTTEIYHLMKTVEKPLKVRILGFQNEEDMIRHLLLQNNDESKLILGGVFFSSFSENVEYKIRFGSQSSDDKFKIGGIDNQKWMTQLTFPPFQLPGPRNRNSSFGGGPEYYKKGFLSVQQAISQAIIQLRSGNKTSSSFDVMMDRMPYPEYINDGFIIIIQNTLPLFLILSFVYTALNIVRNIVHEKERKLKESMKMMGLSNWLHWTAWFAQYMLFLLISIIFMTLLITIKFNTHGKVINKSDPFIIFLFLFLYMTSSIMFCFCISVFFKKANTAAAAGGILWFVSYIPFSFIQQSYDTMSLSGKLGGCILSNVAMGLGSQLIGKWEGQGSGVQWSNINGQVSTEDTFTMAYVMWMFVVDSILYGVIVWYVEAIFPGEFGVPQPWYFPVLRSYWCGNPQKVISAEEFRPNFNRQISAQNPEFFEKEPVNVIPGVQIRKLKKTFKTETGPKTAVNEVSLNMYEGQITALLGHNGAGKTTLMSMLTGLFPPSSGGAVINGYDIQTDMTGVRLSLGLCPQHNILFNTLTVEEHLWFFAMLKGGSSKAATEELDKMLESLAMTDKKTTQSKSLSGGMKRKLSVGIALMADSKIVMLDEPTSGMDPSARRFTWDLLKNYRSNRTILLTTHFMDEADYLGDRIAIMAEGEIKCCGTSLFLKNKYGIGYHMVIVKDAQTCDVNKIINVIQKYVPTASVESNIGAELSFILPREDSGNFEAMFTELEANRTELGINSYGASVTTMEEVFLKVGEQMDDTLASKLTQHCNDEDYCNADTEQLVTSSSMATFATESCNKKMRNSGFILTGQRWYAMFLKRFIHSRRHKAAIASQLLVPLCYTLLALIVAVTFPQPEDSPALKLDMSSFGDNIVTYAFNGTGPVGDISKYYTQQFAKSKIEHADLGINMNMAQYLLGIGQEDNARYNKQYMIAATFLQDQQKVNITSWFNNQAYHTTAISLAAVHNALYQYATNGNGSLTAINHPLPRTAKEAADDLLSRNGVGFSVAFNLLFGMAFLASSFVVFLVQERSNKAKHVQFVSGVDPFSYWTSAYVWDMINYCIPCLLILILFVAFDIPAYTGERLGYVFLILMLYGWAVIPLMYIASFMFQVASTAFVRLTMFNIITGLATLLTVFILSIPQLDVLNVADGLKWAFLVLPNYCLGQGLIDLFDNYNSLSIFNSAVAMCMEEAKKKGFPVQRSVCVGLIKGKLGDLITFQDNYLAWDNPGIGRYLVFLSWLGPVFFFIVLLIEYRVIQTVFYIIFGKKSDLPKGIADITQYVAREDEDVYGEKVRIQQGQSNMDCLTLKGLTKVFRSIGKPGLVAVDHLYLGVPLGECFGLLGINGAGKTTTFKMLTGDETPTSGTAILDGWDLQTHLQKVRQRLGYCPQFDAIIDLMTGREILYMYARLRGVPEADIPQTVDDLIHALLLQDHADNISKTYSGGNKRKLSTAMALVGDPPVIFLDEPTTGMDPVARRLLWDSLCRFRAEGRCIIITSHSMEECEALCTRLAIMVNGQFKCLGSPQHLKGKFGEGYTIMARIASSPDTNVPPNTAPLKQMIEETFPNSVLKDEHEGLVHYHIRDTSKSWAYVFGMMERAKMNYNIEDYSVSQTTLEQVFLNFARGQRITEDD